MDFPVQFPMFERLSVQKTRLYNPSDKMSKSVITIIILALTDLKWSIEKGKSNASLESIEKIAKGLGVSLETLFKGL